MDVTITPLMTFLDLNEEN